MRADPGNTAREHAIGALRELMGAVRPVTLADERVIPVDGSLENLLGGGLKRGTTVRVDGTSGVTSLALSLCARATNSGLWMGCLNIPSIGWAAAESLGLDLHRVVSVEVPVVDVVDAAAAMVDVFDLIVCDGLEGVSRSQSQKISARVRERGCVMVVLDMPVPCGVSPAGACRGPSTGRVVADAVLTVERVRWSGLGDGRGRLRSRSADVLASGRGGMTSPRSATIG